MGVERRVGKLIEATRELMDKPLARRIRDATVARVTPFSVARTFERCPDG